MAVLVTITDAGRAEVINAENTGTAPVLIKTIQLGSGQYTPTADQTELQEPFKPLTTFGGTVVSDDTIHVNIEDDSTDEYTVYEFGLFTDSGTLFAVYSQIGDPVSIKAASSTFLLAVDIVLKTLDADSVTFGDLIFVNPPASETVAGVVYIATQEEVNTGEDDSKAVTPKKLITKITDFLKSYLKISNNLSEIKDAGEDAQSEAQDNLGLGSIVKHDEGDYLPITGGTLTGDLNGTNAKFTGVVTAPDIVTNRINSATSGTPIEFGNSGATGNVDLYLDFHTTFPEVDYDFRFQFAQDNNVIELQHSSGLAALNIGALGVLGLQINNIDRVNGNALIACYDPNGKLFANHGIYDGGFSVNFYDETGAWVSNPFFVGANGNATVTGNLSGGAIFDSGQRVYSPVNPPPATDLSGYLTRADALNTFVQGVRLGSPMQHDFDSGGGAIDSGGTCVVSFSLHGGSDNGGTSMTRYVQVNINGVWANVGVAS